MMVKIGDCCGDSRQFGCVPNQLELLSAITIYHLPVLAFLSRRAWTTFWPAATITSKSINQNTTATVFISIGLAPATNKEVTKPPKNDAQEVRRTPKSQWSSIL